MIPDPSGDELPFRARTLRSVSIGAAGLLLANAGLLVLYFVLDLSLYELVIVYWWEMLWIGVFSAIKLLVASVAGDPFLNRYATISKGSSVILSVVTIGWSATAFLAIFGLVGFLIFQIPLPPGIESTAIDVEGGVILLLKTSMILLSAHGLSFVVNFLIFGEYKLARAATLVALPFRRCLALLVSILVAGALIHLSPEMASATTFAVTIMVFKLFWDYRLHFSERARFAADRD